MLERVFQTVVERWHFNGAAGLYYTIKPLIYSNVRIVRLRLDLGTWKSRKECPTALQIHRGSLPDLLQFRKSWNKPWLPYEFFVDRVNSSQWFYLGYWEGKIIHISWVLTGADSPPLNGLGAGEVEVAYAHTLMPYRGRGILTNTLSAILEDLQHEEIHTVYAHIEEDNLPSLRGFAKLGFYPIGSVALRRTFGIKYMRYTPTNDIDAVQFQSKISRTSSLRDVNPIGEGSRVRGDRPEGEQKAFH